MRFLVPGTPKGKARPRFVRSTGRTYTPPATKEYEASVRYAYLNALDDDDPIMLEGPIRCRIEAVFRIPPSYSRKKHTDCIEGRLQPTGKPDCDNIVKAILDALNGVAYKDDSQVVDVSIIKRYGEIGFATVELEALDGRDPGVLSASGISSEDEDL